MKPAASGTLMHARRNAALTAAAAAFAAALNVTAALAAEPPAKRAAAQTAKAEASALADFDRAVEFARQNQTKDARILIERLLADPSGAVARDRLLLTKARLLYQDGDVRSALGVYAQIRNDSDYWLEALEEKAWAHLRLGEHGAALAQLRTLKAPVFEPLIGPEPYFLTGLIHLKVCDYAAIFDDIKEFKSKFRPRLVAIQELANSGRSEAAQRVIGKLRAGAPLAWKTVAPEAANLPRLFHRDAIFAERVQALQKNGSDETLAAALTTRIRQLAARDLKEISDILQKIQLLEAEVIQRIHLAEKPNTRPNRNLGIDKDDVLIFPDEGEFWMDELDNYHVKVQGCGPAAATGGQKL